MEQGGQLHARVLRPAIGDALERRRSHIGGRLRRARGPLLLHELAPGAERLQLRLIPLQRLFHGRHQYLFHAVGRQLVALRPVRPHKAERGRTHLRGLFQKPLHAVGLLGGRHNDAHPRPPRLRGSHGQHLLYARLATLNVHGRQHGPIQSPFAVRHLYGVTRAQAQHLGAMLALLVGQIADLGGGGRPSLEPAGVKTCQPHLSVPVRRSNSSCPSARGYKRCSTAGTC